MLLRRMTGAKAADGGKLIETGGSVLIGSDCEDTTTERDADSSREEN
jgi:hypothetical protein